MDKDDLKMISLKLKLTDEGCRIASSKAFSWENHKNYDEA